MFFQKSSGLKKMVKELDSRNEDLSSQLNTANSNNDDLLNKIAKLNHDFERLKDASGKVEAERNELKKIVREQTEADLLVNALKGLGIAKTEKPVNTDVFREQQRLSDLQSRAMQMNSSVYNADLSPFSLFGGLG